MERGLFLMEHQKVEIHIQLTEGDYYDFLRASYKVRGIYTNLWFFGAYAALLLSLAIVTGSFSFGTLVLPVIFLVFVLATFYEMKARSKRYFHTDATISKPFTLLMDEDGLEMKSELSYWRLTWRELYNFMVTQKGILIYTSPIKALIIPERYLRTAADIETVSNLLHENVNVKKVDRSTKVRNYIRFGLFIIVVLFIAYTMYVALSAGPEK
jgi:hypothetical protein